MYIGSLEHVLLASDIQELMYRLYRENLFICMVTGWPKQPDHLATGQKLIKLDAKDVLPNINCTQAAERVKNAVFVPGDLGLSSLTLTFKLVRARDQTRLACKFGANTFSGFWDISYTIKKHRLAAPKHNLPQFTACWFLR